MYVKIGGHYRLATQWAKKDGKWHKSGKVMVRRVAGNYASWRAGIYTQAVSAVIVPAVHAITGSTIHGFSSDSYSLGTWSSGGIRGKKLKECWMRISNNGTFESFTLTTEDNKPIIATDGKSLHRTDASFLLVLKKLNNYTGKFEFVHILMAYARDGIYVPSRVAEFSTPKEIEEFAKSTETGQTWGLAIVPVHDITT